MKLVLDLDPLHLPGQSDSRRAVCLGLEGNQLLPVGCHLILVHICDLMSLAEMVFAVSCLLGPMLGTNVAQSQLRKGCHYPLCIAAILDSYGKLSKIYLSLCAVGYIGTKKQTTMLCWYPTGVAVLWCPRCAVHMRMC